MVQDPRRGPPLTSCWACRQRFPSKLGIHAADPARIGDMLDLIERRNLDLDVRSALAQLLMASISLGELNEEIRSDCLERAAAYVATDPEIRESMIFPGWAMAGDAVPARCRARWGLILRLSRKTTETDVLRRDAHGL